jgi:hypothetical protein
MTLSIETRVPAIVLLLTFALLAAGQAESVQARPMFPNPTFGAGLYPVYLALADYDGDGRQDLAVADFGAFDTDPPGLSILLGRSDRAFGAATTMPLDGKPYGLVAADFNGDGKMDLAVAEFDTRTVSVRLGSGDGTFAGALRVATDASPSSLVAGDFNGDHRKDLAVSGSDENGSPFLQVLAGQGDGSFLATSPILGQPLRKLAAGDLNRDGFDDLVASSKTSSTAAWIFRGGPGGLARTPSRLTVSMANPRPTSTLVLADFNGDGRLDLALDCEFGPTFVFPGRGDGTFLAAGGFSHAHPYQALTAGDVNGDGRNDLAGVDQAGMVDLLAGRGDGTFDLIQSYGSGTNLTGIVLGDLDGDGRADAMVSVGGSDAVFVRYANAEGRLGTDQTPAPHGTYSGSGAVGDFNGDGRTDIAACGADDASQIKVALGNDDGTLGQETFYSIAGIRPEAMTAADLDGDGRQDIAVATGLQGSIVGEAQTRPGVLSAPLGGLSVLLGHGDGTFIEPGPSYAVGTNPRQVIQADLNRDGRPDLVVVNGGDSDVGDGWVSIFLGNGDGTFAPEHRLSVGFLPVAAVVADFNSDGRADLAVADYGHIYFNVAGDLSILLGNGDGTFQPRTVVSQGFAPTGLAVADFNADGKSDLVLTDEGTIRASSPEDVGSATVFIGTGDGTFQQPVTYRPGRMPYQVVVGDFNADGAPDFVVSDQVYEIALYLGLGDGSFAPPMRSSPLPYISLFGSADFDSDGRLDLATGSPGGVVLNQFEHGPLAINVSLAYSAHDRRGPATLTWKTAEEFALRGFNVVSINDGGHRTQLNPELVRCAECVTTGGASYSFTVANHDAGRDIFVEVVRLDGSVQTFGPVVRSSPGAPAAFVPRIVFPVTPVSSPGHAQATEPRR